MSAIVSSIIHFLRTDIWRIRLKTVSPRKSFLIKQARIVLLALRGFDEDKCRLRASALTFYSLLSIVPIFAMAFGIAKGFGFEKLLEQQLIAKMPGQEEVINRVIVFANTLLENTKGGLIAGIGVAILFWTVIKVLGDIEHSFNDIWGVRKARSWGRKFGDYLSMMLICPMLIIISSSVTVFVTSQVALITSRTAFLGMFSWVIFFVLKWLPYCAVWVLFTFLYIFMPNTKVKFRSALVAGIVGGSIYQIVQGLYIAFQIGVAKSNAIYGSFAALPLFLVWLQLSWLIILFGAEISFAHQNVDTYELEPDCRNVSRYLKKLFALQITYTLVKNFEHGIKPATANQLSHTLEIPIRLVREILYELTGSRIVAETKTEEERESGYQPACPTDRLTIQYVIDALENKGVNDMPVGKTESFNLIADRMKMLAEAIANSPANSLLRDIGSPAPPGKAKISAEASG